jgi:hypothetical protein
LVGFPTAMLATGEGASSGIVALTVMGHVIECAAKCDTG